MSRRAKLSIAYQCHGYLKHPCGDYNLYEQEYHHVYWGVKFSHGHQAGEIKLL